MFLKVALIILAIIILAIVFIFILLKVKFKTALKDLLGTDSFREAFSNSKIQDEETPKSLSSMESIYQSKIKKDFPHLNINELKAKAESIIVKAYEGIEQREKGTFKENGRINAYIIGKIDEANNTDTHYSACKVHRTVINRYENNSGIATIYFQSSYEYVEKVGNKTQRKVQSRINTEFIYIVDENKVSKKEKTIGLNCPNCGAPLKGVGQRVCTYCGSGTEDIVKRTWAINNIAEY